MNTSCPRWKNNASLERACSKCAVARGEQAGVRTSALLVAVALAVVVVVVLMRYPGATRMEPSSAIDAPAETRGERGLSTVTMNALRNLQSPVEIRFYALPEQSRGAEGLSGLVERVDQLLSDFRQHGRGLVRITRLDSSNNPDLRRSAIADGIEPLSSDATSTGFLGLAVRCDEQRVSIPRLSPEWEQALEFDLTRAILRVTGSKTASAKPVDTTAMNTVAVEEVRRAIPSIDTVSFDEGYQVLHSAALEEFRTVVTSLDGQIKEAQQRVKAAQDSGSESRLKSALEDLQKLQAEQTLRLQEIADKLQKQTKALEQLKESSR